MKKLLLTVSLMVAAAAAFGQGQILFQNGNTTAITNGNQKASVSTMVGLYLNANTAATTLSPGWSIQGTTNLAAPGLFFGNARTTTFPAGTPVAVQIRAWLTAGSFATYEAALTGEPAGTFGASAPFVLTPSASPSPATTLVGNGLTPFTIAPVPEPSSIALGLLGLGAVALFRRRK
jgi:hypothetical protein